MRDDRVLYLAENMDRLSRRDRVFLNNPVIMQGLGLAPVVIPAYTVQNAIILVFAVALLLTPTRMIATFIGQRVGARLRPIIYVLTAGLVYFFASYMAEYVFGTAVVNVGIYLPLLAMEPLILKRYHSDKRERLFTSFKKGLITTLGFSLVLLLVAGLREILAYGTWNGVTVTTVMLLPLASMPAGGFIVLGIIAAVWRSMVFAFKKQISVEAKKLV